MKDKERRLRHASTQETYHRKKMQTHKKVAVWVPHEQVDAFFKSFERMKKKWGS